ncbi:tRNAHis guanylyltransferase [Prunus dulcis]|uniref:tRNAHis guanylyltransferase n=1 Tax=Prunus dulcis TaxID=3755 RepID=A0A4Y1QN46_PRUDU|nr:tRNAHis guanylyltransferase [Prunus dulcis]
MQKPFRFHSLWPGHHCNIKSSPRACKSVNGELSLLDLIDEHYGHRGMQVWYPSLGLTLLSRRVSCKYEDITMMHENEKPGGNSLKRVNCGTL